jgi:hypothetical protein
VNSEWLVIGAISSVPLILGLLSASIDLADLRTRRRGRVAGQPSQPEQKADALLNEWLRPEQRLRWRDMDILT